MTSFPGDPEPPLNDAKDIAARCARDRALIALTMLPIAGSRSYIRSESGWSAKCDAVDLGLLSPMASVKSAEVEAVPQH